MNAKPFGRSGSEGAWVAAIIVIAICLLSSFTLTKGGNATNAASGGRSSKSGVGASDDPSAATGDQNSTDGGGTSASGDTSGDASGGGVVAGGKSGAAGGAAGGGPVGAASAGKKPAAPGSGGIIKAAADCKGNGNRNSDVGVTANSIEFAATVVKTGVAKDFLLDAQYGMEAVRRLVNQQGGICGRLINIHEDDDGWQSDTGNSFIQKYISCNCYFGLAVNPSSEGLRTALDSGAIDQAQFPVIGSDGMLIDQYQHPWIWPVATSTHSAAHVMAMDAVQNKQAKKIGIVYDESYKFGKEGDLALKEAATRRGATVVVNTSVQAGQTSYKNAVSSFLDDSSGCGHDFSKCDFVAMLLEPSTADQFVRDGGLGDGTKHPAKGIGVPQPLFLDSFANNCGAPCAGLQAWTGFRPPLPPFDTDQNVAAYKSAVKAVNSAADTNNPEVEGAFQGMLLLVQALAQAGPAPTRQAIKQILDSSTIDTGLGPKATFNGSNHFAAIGVQPFEAVYNNNDFTGWRFPNGAQFISDPEVDKDMPSN